MSNKYSHDQVLQSIQPNRKKYEAIALSTAITMELEDLMEQKGISKKELAAAAGVSPSYLSQVFSGDKLINISMLAGISNEFNVVFRVEIQDKKPEEFLYADNRSLVEQMNAMALKPNQAVIEYFYPKYNPENRRIENLPTEECPCIVELYSGEYDIVWWIDDGLDETGWNGYCIDEVKSWAYLPKGVNND